MPYIEFIPWWLSAILFSFFIAGVMLVNQQYKINPIVLMVWRGLGTAFFMLPFMFMLPAPETLKFYTYAGFLGIIIGYFDNRIFAASSKYGAGGVSRLLPSSLAISFILWLFIEPHYLIELSSQPLRMIGIIICLIGIITSLNLMRKDNLSRDLLYFLLPTIIAAAVVDTINKLTMKELTEIGMIVYYIFVLSFVSGSINLFVLLKISGNKFNLPTSVKERVSLVFEPNTVKGGVLIILTVTFAMFAKGYSMAHAGSPAYVAAIGFAAPLWIALYNRIRKIKDDINIILGFALILFLLIMIILTI